MLALFECPECRAKISDQADCCIHCGYPLKKHAVAAERRSGMLDGNPHFEQSSQPNLPRLLSGNPHYSSQPLQGQGIQNQAHQQQVVKTAKSRGVFIILGILFGFFGIHNFYAGYFARGIVQFLTVAILGWLFFIGFAIVFVWVLIEFLVVTTDAAGDEMV